MYNWEEVPDDEERRKKEEEARKKKMNRKVAFDYDTFRKFREHEKGKMGDVEATAKRKREDVLKRVVENYSLKSKSLANKKRRVAEEEKKIAEKIKRMSG